MSRVAAPVARPKSPPRRRFGPRPLRWAAFRSGWAALAVLALGGFLSFYGLTTGELYRTETLRAIIAAEFLRSGNWIVPTLYGEPLFTKPPGMYAAIALASWPVGGVTEWSARLPSALASFVTVFLVYRHFARTLGRLGGLVAGAMLPASLLWLDKATAAEIDMMQTAWVTGAILCFLRALEIAEEPDPGTQATVIGYRVAADGAVQVTSRSGPFIPAHWPGALGFWWSAALLCVAGGVLTKWTAPAFFYGMAVPLLGWRGRLRLLWGRHHGFSAALGAGICLTWAAAAVALTDWHSLYDTVSREALMRLLPSHHYRPYPWRETLLHPLKILAANLPWSPFALLTLRPGFARLWEPPGRRLLQALHCWTWPNLLFWSIIPEHAPRHSFPLTPGLLGLAAFVWIAWLTGRLPRSPRAVGYKGDSPPSASEPSPLFPAALSLKVRSCKRALRPTTVFVGMLIAWIVVKLVFVHVVTPIRESGREPGAKGELLAALVPRDKPLYLFRLKDEGLMFYYGRTVRRLGSPSQLPSSTEPLYCILDGAEWRQPGYLGRPAEVVQGLCDEQGDPIVLVRLARAAGPAGWGFGK